MTQAPEKPVQLLDLPQPALATILTQLDARSAVHLAQSNKRILDIFVGCQQAIATKSLAEVLQRVLVSASFRSNLDPQGSPATLSSPVRITIGYSFRGSDWQQYVSLLSTGMLASPAVSQLLKQGAAAVADLTTSKEPFLPPSKLSWKDCLAAQPDVWGLVGLEAVLRVPDACSAWFYGRFNSQLDILSTVFRSLSEVAFAEELEDAGACLRDHQRQLRRLSVTCRGGSSDILKIFNARTAASQPPSLKTDSVSKST